MSQIPYTRNIPKSSKDHLEYTQDVETDVLGILDDLGIILRNFYCVGQDINEQLLRVFICSIYRAKFFTLYYNNVLVSHFPIAANTTFCFISIFR